jgi:hypothetical protein
MPACSVSFRSKAREWHLGWEENYRGEDITAMPFQVFESAAIESHMNRGR